MDFGLTFAHLALAISSRSRLIDHSKTRQKNRPRISLFWLDCADGAEASADASGRD